MKPATSHTGLNGEAMPSAKTHIIKITPTCRDKRSQLYSVTFEDKIIIERTRNPTADACRHLVSIGLCGRLEVWNHDRSHPSLILPNMVASAKITVREDSSHSPRFTRYEPFKTTTEKPEAAQYELF